MSIQLNAKIQIKRGSGNPGTTLDLGELGLDTVNSVFYIGTGVGSNPIVFQTASTISHGALLNLNNDDHTQYTLVSGTRAFTGKVSYSSHPTFSTDTELVDKKYVDDEIGGLTTDHGGLSGLGDDDHTQYILVAGTRNLSGILSYTTAFTFLSNNQLITKKYADDLIGTYTTDNLSEGSTNLYYTDARVNTRIGALSIGALSDVDTTTSAPALNNFLKWDGSNWIPGTGDGIGDMLAATYDPTSINASAFDYDNFINTPPLLSTTDNLTEGTTNLYYTDGRVLTYINTLSIDELADIDTTTIAPNTSDKLEWNGTNWVPLDPNNQVFDIYQNTITTSISVTGVDVPILWDSIYQQGSHFTFTSGTSTITISTTGRYLISYNLSMTATSTVRTQSRAAIRTNGIVVNGTYSYGYHRNATEGKDSLNKTITLSLTQNDTIDIIIRRNSGTSTINSILGNSLTITKL